MSVLGNGLDSAEHHEDALLVKEAELSMLRRRGGSGGSLLTVLTNLANTYSSLGRKEKALSMQREAYAAKLEVHGEEDIRTLGSAYNIANFLSDLYRFKEAKSLLRKTLPVARRILGESNEVTLKMRSSYAEALYRDDGATFDDLREAVTTLEEAERTARRVLGGAHPITKGIEVELQNARVALVPAKMREAIAAMTAGDA